MPKYQKNFLSLLLVIFILAASLVFLGTNYPGEYPGSILGIITARVTINPLAVEVSVPYEVELNKIFKVEAKVKNRGEEKIENARAEIFLPQGLRLLKKDPSQGIGVIRPKKEKKISWSVRGEKVGNYIITVLASGELGGEVISEEGSSVVTIKERTSSSSSSFDFFQNFTVFFQDLFRLRGQR